MSSKNLKKTNCWEFMKCGREPGGSRADELGVCPAAAAAEFDGINQGLNGGRICWAIPRTICNGSFHGTFTLKLMTCVKCPFFQQVKMEEGIFDFHFGLWETVENE